MKRFILALIFWAGLVAIFARWVHSLNTDPVHPTVTMVSADVSTSARTKRVCDCINRFGFGVNFVVATEPVSDTFILTGGGLELERSHIHTPGPEPKWDVISTLRASREGTVWSMELREGHEGWRQLSAADLDIDLDRALVKCAEAEEEAKSKVASR